MADPAEQLEAPDEQLEKELEAEKKKVKPAEQVKPETIEDIRKKRESLKQRRQETIKGQRRKPTHETLEKEKDVLGEAFERSEEEEKMELERAMLKEQLEKSGIRLSEEEITILDKSMPELVGGVSPEFAKYLGQMSPRLTKVLQETARLKAEKNEYEAVQLLADFIDKETKGIEKIKDPVTKKQVFSFMGAAIDMEKVIADMKKQTKIDGATNIAKIIPIVGPAIELKEAATGKTAAGEKLSGGKRVTRAVMGTGFMVMDVAGLVSGGATTAARVGITAAKAGKGAKQSLQAAKGAYKTAEAAKKASKVASIAVRGAKAGKSITRFAALCRKTGKLKRVSKIIYKVGKIVQKHPRLSGFLVKRLINRRATYKGRFGVVKLGVLRSAKAAATAGKSRKVTKISDRVERIKPRAAPSKIPRKKAA